VRQAPAAGQKREKKKKSYRKRKGPQWSIILGRGKKKTRIVKEMKTHRGGSLTSRNRLQYTFEGKHTGAQEVRRTKKKKKLQTGVFRFLQKKQVLMSGRTKKKKKG